ncbi:aggregation promoting factor surface protein [Levilactobacillus yiduensis]|uniref:aggregation-promoting factor C-terminal-like domain-containing protein n=1 Tax=Levilactobacillus yiduensis TaxID=2953880 RepID=UPI000EF33D54|nr:aggregation promoting factor surface protein [Levilactobacillus yiduensis]AYM02042.1 aggregation promoting factor surface protein [Levilactobacillus brevis]
MKLKTVFMLIVMVVSLALPSVSSVVKPATTAEASVTYTCKLSKKEQRAKAWIAVKESGGNYRARNGRYYGKYQLTISMLKGDYSKANQEKTADRYAHNRYGSWTKAKRHWLGYGWF